jgi:tetratricopeptide (TPR) repeat protein
VGRNPFGANRMGWAMNGFETAFTSGMRRNLHSLLFLALLYPAVSLAGGPEFGLAAQRYQQTDYRGALSILLPVNPKDAAVDALIGKAYFMDGQYKNSTSYLQKAVVEDPLNSTYFDWLGKANGRRAEQASFLTALPLANKTREAFEKAVALDASNVEALSDLFEYYLQAPGVVGGGVDKAQALAERIGRVNQAEYHYALARLAAKRKDYRNAEVEYRNAMQLAPGDIGRVIDLASFLSKQSRYDESERYFDMAAQMAPDAPKLMFARAEAYIRSGRNTAGAKALLSRYGEARITPDDPSRGDAARLIQALR